MVPLEDTKLFCDLTPADLDSLRKVTQELRFEPDQVIFKQGDEGNGIFLVKDGSVKIMVQIAHGDLRPLSSVAPGELFGEMAVLDNQPRSASAIADGPSIVYFISRSDLMALFERTPRLAIALIREISQRLRDFNRQYIKEVFEAERLALVGRFASSIVHDIKNPLNIIGLSAEMACASNATPQARDGYKTRIRKQIDRIRNMVSELLEFARGSSSQVVLSPMDYAAYTDQLFEDIRHEVALRSVNIKFESPPPPVTILMDPQRLSRVFHNLAGNAVDAMPDGGIIAVRFRQENGQLITELQDSGAGIAPEIADRLFQAFATYGKSNGTGLGLTICKKIINDHNGNIYAKNDPNGGAIFGFSLPIYSR